MYGFLQLDRSKLNLEDKASYTQMYCGQCASLHKMYGYTRRAMVSFDATFLGLLLSAQLNEEPTQTKSRCGAFPKKITIHDPEELPQTFSASMAAIICSMKLSDSQQDGKSYLKTIAGKICSPTFIKAEETLRTLNFPVGIVAETIELQNQIELSERRGIKEYAEPTALFLAETFRFTSSTTGNKENEAPLYEIGYHVGQLIYLVDSCVDIIEDIDTDNFNGLMAAYRNEETILSQYSRDEVTAIAINSLTKIRELIQALDLKRHHNIIANILLIGLPATIHQRITKSISILQKGNSTFLKYLPHTALASALCLLSSQNAEAGWLWGQSTKDGNYFTYGFSCCASKQDKQDECCAFFLEAPFNPLVYYVPNSNSIVQGNGIIYCCEGPKIGLLLLPLAPLFGCVSSFMQGSVARQHRREAEKQAQIAQKRQDTISKNRQYVGRYTQELQGIEQYFKSINFSYKTSDNINSLINSAGGMDNEAISEKHENIKQIESLMNLMRQDRQQIESAYSKQQTRNGRYSGKSMAMYENISTRKLTTLLISCANSFQPLLDLVIEDFEKTDAYRLWQQLDEYFFISGNAKRCQEKLKNAPQNSCRNMALREVFEIYKELKILKVMIEKSNQALFSSQKQEIDVIHNDWNWYYAKLNCR